MGPRVRVCCMCRARLAPEDPGYVPADYRDLVCCAHCAPDYRRWEAWERNHKGKIVLRTIRMTEPFFECRKRFYDSKWTRQRILEEMLALDRAGKIRQCYREDPALWNAARRLFGTWRKALRAFKAHFNGSVSRKSTPPFRV